MDVVNAEDDESDGRHEDVAQHWIHFLELRNSGRTREEKLKNYDGLEKIRSCQNSHKNFVDDLITPGPCIVICKEINIRIRGLSKMSCFINI